MRRISFAFIAVIFFALPLNLTAQQGEPQHAPDFRARQTIKALFFGPKANAPFVATAKTVWVKIMPDNSTITTENHRYLARDMDGRIFQERRGFVSVPNDGKQEPQLQAMEYGDPLEHSYYSCNPYAKTCALGRYFVPTMSLIPSGLQPDGTTYLTRENLGEDTFEGLDVQRSRETYTYYKQTIGNTNTILRVVDYWYSPLLDINVKVVRHDPRDGEQTLWLTDISLTAPDPTVFQVPAEYKIIDYRHLVPMNRSADNPQ